MRSRRGSVAISIESRDDLGLSSLTLRFTKASGGGENVAFSEGEVPLRLERRNEQQWMGSARPGARQRLDLADGDILVYRAIARDTNPDGSPVQSEQYLIEIGKNAQIADAGFALPSEEKKYAISQQMVIYKTEQLIEEPLQPSPRLGRGRLRMLNAVADDRAWSSGWCAPRWSSSAAAKSKTKSKRPRTPTS